MNRTISTAGYSSIVVQFAWANNGTAAAEYSQAQYTTDRITWTSFQQLTGPTPPSLTQVTYSSLPIAVENNANFGLRWRIYGSANSDYLYVDDVTVTGIPM